MTVASGQGSGVDLETEDRGLMTPRATRPPRSEARPPAFVPPYPPSWVDRFTDGVERLPIPWWSFYVIVALVLEAIQGTILWRGGSFSLFGGPFFPLSFPLH